MKKPAIPYVQNDPSGVLTAIKENIEIVTGRRATKITELDTTNITGYDLTLAQKVNEILARLQA